MTALRQIGALDLPSLTPADLTGAPLPMLEWLDIDELWVNPTYQRDIGPASLKLIVRLVEGWDWLKLAPLLVAITENGFEVIDGQTRATAAKLHPQITTVPCYVYDGATLPQRAEAFVSHARARVAVTPGQLHHAEVAARVESAVAVDDVCRAAGIRLLPFSPAFATPYQVGDTTALGSIKAMLARRGAEKTTEILRALVAAGLMPVTAQHIRAAEALCCEPEYAAEFGPEQLTAALVAVGFAALVEVRALAAAKGLPMWRAWTALLFKHRRARPVGVERTVRPVETPAPRAALASAETDSAAVRTPEKGSYQASTPSAAAAPKTANPLGSKARVIDRRPVGAVNLGDPPPGRSALDERRRAGA